jgi:hypothetical protein
MATRERRYLTQLTASNPVVTGFSVDLVVQFGLNQLVTSVNQQVWAAWFKRMADSILTLSTTNMLYIQLQDLLNATSTNISPLQVCISYKSVEFFRVFMELGCQIDANMVLPKRLTPISIRKYIENEGLIELQELFR